MRNRAAASGTGVGISSETDIHGDTEEHSAAFRINVENGGWAHNISNCTMQTQETASSVEYTPEGKYGFWIQGADGVHAQGLEVIDFSECLVIDSVGAVNSFGSSNSKFVNCAFEAEPGLDVAPPAGGKWRGGRINATVSSFSLVACTFFGGFGTGSVGLEIDATGAAGTVNDISISDTRCHTSKTGCTLDNSFGSLRHGPWLFSNCKMQAGSPVFGTDVVPWHVRLVNCYNDDGDHYPHTGNIDAFAGRSAMLLDEFAMGDEVSGHIGALGWNIDGGTFASDITVVPGHPGIGNYQTGATINTRCRLSLPKRKSVFNIIGLFSSAEWFELTWIIRLDQTSDTKSRLGMFQIQASAGDGAPGADDPPAEGMYFERVADANWQAICRTGAVETKVDTGVVVDTDWHKFVIRRVKDGGGASGTIRFVIDEDEDPLSGAGATDISASIPTNAAMGAMFYLENLAAANKIAKVDHFSLRLAHINNRF